MHGQSPASPEGGRYLSRVGGGVVALGQTGERHPWISFYLLGGTQPDGVAFTPDLATFFVASEPNELLRYDLAPL